MASVGSGSGRTLFIREVPVEFPFEPYPCQVQYMDYVIAALQSGKNALLESPTGTGKTLGLLCATLAWRTLLIAQVQGQAKVGKLFKLDADAGRSDVHEALLSRIGSASGVKVQRDAGVSALVSSSVTPREKTTTRVTSVPRIIYLTRTHSQIRQAVRELGRTAYGASTKAVVLGSRQHLCVHPSVSRIQHATVQNVRCTQLAQHRRCSFYVNAEETFKEVPDDFYFIESKECADGGRRPRDLEDLVAYGRQRATCPYFLSREAAAEADILFMPYNYLFDAKCRRSLGLNVEGDIVICDEAHNLESICCDSLSFDFTPVDRQRCVSALQQLARALSCGLLSRDGKDGPNSDQGLQAADIQALLDVLFALEAHISLVCTSHSSVAAEKSNTMEAGNVWLQQRRRLNGIEGVVLPGPSVRSFFRKAVNESETSDERYEQLLRALENAIRALTQLRQRDIDHVSETTEETAAPETIQMESADDDPYAKLRQRHLGAASSNPSMAWTHQVHALEQLSHVLELVWAFGKAETASAFAICVHDPSKGTPSARLGTDPTRLKIPSIDQNRSPATENLFRSSPTALQHCRDPLTRPRQDRPQNTVSPAYTLSFWCLSPGLALREAVSDTYTVLLTSGTLSPMESFASEMSIPFPVRLRNMHVVDPQTQVFAATITHGPRDIRLNSSYANRHNREYVLDLGSALINIARLSPGGMLVFFPSYAVLAQFAETWQTCSFVNAGKQDAAHRPRRAMQATIWDRLNALKRIYMEPRAAEASQQTIDAYRQWIQSGHDACLLAVCRGRTGEGIDFADEYGRTVVLVGLPFPSTTDPRIILKRDYLERQALELRDQDTTISGRTWYVQQCLRAANQAMGRVIRHANDFGAILLCDERFRGHWRELPLWLTATSNDPEQPSRSSNVVQTIERFGDLIVGLCAFWRSARISELTANREGERRKITAVVDEGPTAPLQSRERPGEPLTTSECTWSSERKRLRPAIASQETRSWLERRQPATNVRPSSRHAAHSFVSELETTSGTVPNTPPSTSAGISGMRGRERVRHSQPASKAILERIRARVGDRTFTIIFQQMKRYYRAAMTSRQQATKTAEMHQIHGELSRLVGDATDFQQLCLLLGHPVTTNTAAAAKTP